MYGTVFVASPKATARTPVASGSSVPAWPAFFAPKAQIALCHGALLTTLCQRDYAGSHKTAAELHAEMDALRREIEQLID